MHKCKEKENLYTSTSQQGQREESHTIILVGNCIGNLTIGKYSMQREWRESYSKTPFTHTSSSYEWNREKRRE